MPEPLLDPLVPWLAERARRDPWRTAVRDIGGAIPFAELAARGAQIAGRLAALGVRAGDRVAVVMESSLRWVEVMHGVAWRGAILVPLNPRLAPGEVAAVVADADLALLVHDAALASRLEALPRGRIPMIAAGNEVDSIPPARLDTPHRPERGGIHTIVYTSGTTGRPKGAMLTPENHFASATASRANLGARPDDCWLVTLPPNHVGGLSILLRSVIDGIPVILHPDFDADRANRAIHEEGVTLTSLVATTLRRLLDGNGDRRYPPTLRAVLVGGGPAPRALVERALALGMPVLPTYGLTEAASQVATAEVGAARRKPGSVGRALPGTCLRLDAVDREGRGEILVRGPTVMAGYFRDPAATSRAVRDGWLHTGDLGHFDDEGCLYVDGRRDDLIVSGGENVYPAEVEAVLAAHPAVAEAVVFAEPDPIWGQRVAAAIVPRTGFNPDEAGIRAWCDGRLARFKIPRSIHLVSVLPRTASGKVRRAEFR